MAQDGANQSALMTTETSDPPLSYGIAKLLLQCNHFATLTDTGEILLYKDGTYQLGGEAYIKQKIQQNVEEESVSKRLCEEVIGHIERSTYHSRSEFDSDPTKLVLDNCLLDLETFEMQSHTPEYLSRVKLPVRYDPNADCPKIKKFLSEVMYPEDIPVMQEWIGYCLWRNYEAQKAMLLIGDGGNGKSTTIGILKALLGIQNISSRSLQDLELNRFAKADLYGKLANLYPDLPDTALKSTGTFKMLTGGDPITAEYKFKNAFSYMNYAKLTFSCNKVPEAYDETTAFFRRWIMLVFPNKFEGDREDKNLLKQLTTPEELSGFLNWSLEGLKRLMGNGWVFSYSKSTDQIREEYIRKSSPIQSFLMDCVEINPDGHWSKQEVFNAFAKYCRTHKLPVVCSDTFFKNIPKYITVETARRPWNSQRAMCFIGIKLKNSADIKMEKPLDRLDTLDTSQETTSTVSTQSRATTILSPTEQSELNNRSKIKPDNAESSLDVQTLEKNSRPEQKDESG